MTLGAYARRNWAPDYPIGRRPEQDGWLRPTAEQWGAYAARRFLAERAPSIADDEEAIEWYTSYLVRGASPSAVAAITDMNEEIDVPPRAGTVRVPALVMYRDEEYLRAASEYMGERLPGARVVGVPGTDHLPWEGDQESVLAQIETFFGELGADGGRAGADPDDRARGRGAATRSRGLPTRRSRASAAASSTAPAGRVSRELRRPGPRGPVRERARRASSRAARRRPHRRVRVARRRRLSGAALEIAAGVAGAAQPGEILATSTVRDLVAGSGMEFAEHGTVTLARLTTGACLRLSV